MRQSELAGGLIVALVREAEKGEKSIAQLAQENQVTEQTIYRRWRKYGGSPIPDVRRLKQLEKENARLLRLLGQREVEIDGTKELLRKNGERPAETGRRESAESQTDSRAADRHAARDLQDRDAV